VNWIPRMDTIRNVLIVCDQPEDEVTRMFGKCLRIGTVTNRYAREHDIGIYLLMDSGPGFTEYFYNLLKTRIENFDIF
jgi:hypothetical protein